VEAGARLLQILGRESSVLGMNLAKEKQRLRRFVITIFCLVCGSTLADPLVLTLEEPQEGGTYTGISNLRGWAIAESGIDKIELDIDGVYAFDIPMGGSRGDVESAYPDFPNAAQSGFSMAFNYKALAAGVASGDGSCPVKRRSSGDSASADYGRPVCVVFHC